jgi:dipeptidyl-peptidase 4
VSRPHCLFVVVGLPFLPFTAVQSAAQPQPKKVLTIEAIVAPGGLTGRAPENFQLSPDGRKLSFIQRDDTGEHGELWYIDPSTGEKKILVSEAKLATLSPDVNKIKNEPEKERITRYSIAAYHWSPDSKHLLFDSLGQLWMYGLDNGTAVQLTSAPEPSDDPKFSPDGANVAFVRKHNLYSRPVSGENEKQLTKDTDENLLNGEVDWVYAEELDVRSNYFWSPDSSQIAFLRMDETRVPTYPITDWLPTHPEVDHEKYPKAGDPNPTVRLGAINCKSGGIRWISLTDDSDSYIPRFGWVRDGILWAQVLNRNQDKLDIYFIDAKTGRSHRVLSETSPEAWVKVTNDFRILTSGDHFLWSSWRDGHTHLYLYNFDKANPLRGDAKLEKQLTQGDYEVGGIEAVDESAGVVYFSTNKDDPRQTHLYSVKLDGSALRQISKEPGTHSASFWENDKYYSDTYSASLAPPRRWVCAATGSPCYGIWKSRSAAQYGFRSAKDLEFKAEDGTLLYGALLLPEDAPAGGKIPLILTVYGGPAAQTVRNSWNVGVTDVFSQLLAQHGFASFSVDNRGTPNRGRKFEAALRRQFGGVELRDQLASLEQLLEQYPQLDRSRICIYGWSNGGSMTLYALEHSEVFRCGASGAPVTDWHNYDTVYTERYMGLPKDNPQGYLDSSMVLHAGNLHGSLLLLQGTVDDNVHLQNTIQAADALINAGKLFQLMLFPNKTHGVRGKAREFQLQLLLNFFEHNLR